MISRAETDWRAAPDALRRGFGARHGNRNNGPGGNAMRQTCITQERGLTSAPRHGTRRRDRSVGGGCGGWHRHVVLGVLAALAGFVAAPTAHADDHADIFEYKADLTATRQGVASDAVLAWNTRSIDGGRHAVAYYRYRQEERGGPWGSWTRVAGGHTRGSLTVGAPDRRGPQRRDGP